MRRAQSMGINVVIIAAIALLVFVIIAIVVASGGRDLARGTQSCIAQGGTCDFNPPGNDHINYEEVTDCENCCPQPGHRCWRYNFGGS
jgi:hypothetical protein